MTAARLSVLGNGLRVVSANMPGLETAAVGVWIDAGARCESAETNGVAHLLEHMAFKGTHRRSALAIAEEIESVGGHLNAYTSRESTAYLARVLKENVPLAVDILADILLHSIMPDDELEREREVVVQEIAQVHDTPDDMVFDLFQETAYPDQPLGRAIMGTPETVGGLTREVLADYMAEHYSAERMVVVAAGRVEHEEIVGLCTEAFADLPTRTPGMVEPARYRGGDKRQGRGLEQVHLVMGFNGVSYGDPGFYAQQVLATALGGGMSSRLFQEVREKRGLAYSVFAFASSYVDSGLFGIYAGTGERRVGALVPVICEEMVKIGQTVGEDEIARARAQLKASLLMSLESPSARCEQIGRQMLVYGRPIPPAEIIEHIDAVDVGALTGMARRLIDNGPPTITALGPVGGVEPYNTISARFA
ncbi:MAG: M16 family metallopeptidase [Alphaproteobacteria bacterium]